MGTEPPALLDSQILIQRLNMIVDSLQLGLLCIPYRVPVYLAQWSEKVHHESKQFSLIWVVQVAWVIETLTVGASIGVSVLVQTHTYILDVGNRPDVAISLVEYFD